MSDDYTEDPDEEVEEGPVLRKLRKQIKEANEAAATAVAENAVYKRESAFREAGINPSDPKARYFVKGYDGELSVEAIKAEALEAGVIGSEPSSIPENEMRAQEQASEIVAGADSPILTSQQAEYEAEMAAAASTEAVYAVMDKYGSPRVKELL